MSYKIELEITQLHDIVFAIEEAMVAEMDSIKRKNIINRLFPLKQYVEKELIKANKTENDKRSSLTS